ncbi:hypothetical protein EYF80_053256 [Liparis tanakae]|uniref:Uncharacterized protein n=1 Tax=Liparis tanakae TaxID=230148 RepID=A0A4Z2F608_9TELE|nr:hypothetical protein EYF80_053256 [Liparis tanakae]
MHWPVERSPVTSDFDQSERESRTDGGREMKEQKTSRRAGKITHWTGIYLSWFQILTGDEQNRHETRDTRHFQNPEPSLSAHHRPDAKLDGMFHCPAGAAWTSSRSGAAQRGSATQQMRSRHEERCRRLSVRLRCFGLKQRCDFTTEKQPKQTAFTGKRKRSRRE